MSWRCGGGDHELALARGDRPTVDGDGDVVGRRARRAARALRDRAMSTLSVPIAHRRHDAATGISHPRGDLGVELLGEQRQRRVHRDVRRRPDEADRRHPVRERHGVEAEALARGVGKVARADRLADLRSAGRGRPRCRAPLMIASMIRSSHVAALAARHALAAGLVGVEAAQRLGGRRDVGGVVHHHDRAGSEHRSGSADAACPRTGGRAGREGTTAPNRRRARTSSARCRHGCRRRSRRRRGGRGTSSCR